VDTIERGDRKWKEAQRYGEDRVNLGIPLLFPVSALSCFLPVAGCPWYLCIVPSLYSQWPPSTYSREVWSPNQCWVVIRTMVPEIFRENQTIHYKTANSLQKREWYENWWKFNSFLLHANPSLETKYPIIDNISQSYNLVRHYVSPFKNK